MFCQWCGKDVDPGSVSIHHCGSKDRPPAFCIGCGTPLLEGAGACTACGTLAGQPPVAAAAAAPVAAAAVEPVAPEPSLRPIPAPMTTTPVARASSATRRADDDEMAALGALRRGQLFSAGLGALAFFISWGVGPVGTTGVIQVEYSPFQWWGAPSAQILFTLLLVAFVVRVFTLRSYGATVDWVVAGIGFVLVICCVDWLWLLRHELSYITGFWIVAASSVAMTGFGLAGARRASSS